MPGASSEAGTVLLTTALDVAIGTF